MTTGIDVTALLRDGDEVADVADRLDRAGREIRDWEYAGRGALPGAVMSETAMADTARMWETTLTSLAAQVREFGAGLSQAAVDYRSADTQAADRLYATDGPVPR